MSRTTILLALTVAVALAGCGEKNTKPDPGNSATTPVMIEVTTKLYVPIDPTLTAHVPDPAPETGATGESLLNGYNARGKALESCNGRLDDVAGVQGTKPPC